MTTSEMATVLAGLLVWFVLIAPNRLDLITPEALIRIPIEGILLVALVLVLPRRAGRVVAAVAGAVLGLLMLVKILDIPDDIPQDLLDKANCVVVLPSVKKGAIEIAPVAYMRGRTLNNAFVVVDEAQNCTYAQIKMVLTRLGWHSTMVITGDPDRQQVSRRSTEDLTLVETVLADKWGGAKLNGPNDIVIDAAGGIYFSDPDYGRWNDWIGSKREPELGFKTVFRIPPEGGGEAFPAAAQTFTGAMSQPRWKRRPQSRVQPGLP